MGREGLAAIIEQSLLSLENRGSGKEVLVKYYPSNRSVYGG